MIRLTIPSLDDDDFQAVQAVLASGYLVQGAHVAAFEQAVASHVGCAHAVAVSNGTAALHLALVALGVGPGDIVVVTAYSWPATANVIELCGAQAVFVDIHPGTFNMDPACLDETLTRVMSVRHTAQRVKAILPVHTFGQMADMTAIGALAERYSLPIIEDAACALGAMFEQRQAGTWGCLGCLSFHPRKAITTGEGGMILSNDAGLAKHLRALRNHGLDPEAATPDFILPGFNYRMSELQAALGTTQMHKLTHMIADRQRLASVYNTLLAPTPLRTPWLDPGGTPVYQSYVTLLPAALAVHRSTLIQQLKQQGIETTIGTWHLPMTRYFRERYGYRPGDFPVTDDIFARSLTLPLYTGLTADEQQKVCHALGHLLEEYGQ